MLEERWVPGAVAPWHASLADARYTMPVLDRWVVGFTIGGMALYLGASMLLGIAPHERWRLRRAAKRTRTADARPIDQSIRRAVTPRSGRPRNQNRGMQ